MQILPARLREVEESTHHGSWGYLLAGAWLNDQHDPSPGVVLATNRQRERKLAWVMGFDVSDDASVHRDPTLFASVLSSHTARIGVGDMHTETIADGVRETLLDQLAHLCPSHILRV